MDYSTIRGFNYQPSYGSSGLELWQNFDPAIINQELGRSKKYFPKMNAIRLMLSWDAFKRNPDRFSSNFDAALGIAAKHGLVVMPVLFNRWHDTVLDYGGIYIDHFLPRASWVQEENMFLPYLEAVVGKHAADPRVFAWDICNEPFSYSCAQDEIPDIAKAEYTWLEETYNTCKQLGAQAPVTVGIVGIHHGQGREGNQQIEPISDILSIHPYWRPPHDKTDHEKSLDECVAFAARVKKPLLATETCWGALDDEKRVEIIRYTLGELKKRGIGWLAYLLNHSLIADAHRPEFGPVQPRVGNLSFIEADGSLRPGHEVFNEF